MGRVDAVEAPTMGADMLSHAFQRGSDRVAAKRLRHALPYVDEGEKQAHGKQYSIDDTGEIHAVVGLSDPVECNYEYGRTHEESQRHCDEYKIAHRYYRRSSKRCAQKRDA